MLVFNYEIMHNLLLKLTTGIAGISIFLLVTTGFNHLTATYLLIYLVLESVYTTFYWSTYPYSWGRRIQYALYLYLKKKKPYLELQDYQDFLANIKYCINYSKGEIDYVDEKSNWRFGKVTFKELFYQLFISPLNPFNNE